MEFSAEDFSNEQLHYLFLGMRLGLDIKAYAKPDFNTSAI